MKICPVGAKTVMRTITRTDMSELIVTFRNFAEVPEKGTLLMSYREIIAVYSKINTKLILSFWS